MKKNYILAGFLTCLSLSVFAQSAQQKMMQKMKDSLTFVALSDYATKYPILRQGSLNKDFIGGRSVTGEFNGKDLYQGKINMTRIRSNFNFPIAQWGKNTIISTLGYQQIHFETNDVKSFSPQFPNDDQRVTKRTVGFATSFTRSDSIFNHPVTYSAGMAGLTDDASSIKRVNYTASITVPVRRSLTSSLTLGLVVLVDPSAVAPVIPVISYWCKIKTDLDLYVDLPQRVVIRKQLSKKSWVFVGSELGGNLYFFDLNQPGLPENNIYTSIDIRSGATFEYLLSKKIVLSINGGMYTNASSRIYDHNSKPGEYFFKTSNGSAPYISFSISFLPFLRSLTH